MGHTTRKYRDFFGTYVTQWMGYKRTISKSGQIPYYTSLQVTYQGLYQVLSKKDEGLTESQEEKDNDAYITKRKFFKGPSEIRREK